MPIFAKSTDITVFQAHILTEAILQNFGLRIIKFYLHIYYMDYWFLGLLLGGKEFELFELKII